MSTNREYFYRRLHSLLGVIPVGGFLLVHLTVNYYAVRGAEQYNQAAQFMESLPYRYFLEIFFIFIPLIFHAVYGLYIAFQSKHNTSTYSFFRNWMFRLQRITGVILIIFVSWHVWETRIAAQLGAEVNFNMMAEIFESPVALIFYIVGVTGATFHFANGLWSFAITWGITVSPRSQQISTYVTMAIFVALTYVGIRSIFAFIG